ncbi:hypothetical protein DPMN_018686 [Dreissena polymorpha]|uniref:Uncharacterized protein n=1 Tax=Dreissena polymorpha TaxID=45954 RepID=A0A9D4NDN1_DREPO|nr:hypothetical protein DPMN_018686 [Dreissena polymorpha]
MADLYPAYRFSLTSNRKRITMLGRMADRQRAHEIADFLKHTTSTADRHYAPFEQL